MIGVIPIGYFLHYRSQNPGQDLGPSLWSQWVPDFRADWERNNAAYTEAVEQAGRDRALFLNSSFRQNVALRSNE